MEYTENTAVGCVIMASGRAGRFGSNKLLADFGGAPLIARALDVTETPALAGRAVVTRSPEVAELACKAGMKTILHSLPGRNDTVRLGLEALLSELPGLAGCIFLPGDQPLLRKESLEAMARDFSALDEKERAILRLGFRAEDGTERLGSPVLFGSSYFGALCSLPEGKGGGVVIRQHPESVQAVYAARQEELEDADEWSKPVPMAKSAPTAATTALHRLSFAANAVKCSAESTGTIAAANPSSGAASVDWSRPGRNATQELSMKRY